MNWTKFQTYDQSPDKAFETLCNQLFENWCKKEYRSLLASFCVVNGAGGDGGVESYATLSDGSIVGLQAKWFLTSISNSQINQIKKSIQDAMKIRSEIVRYIVCIPRDLTSKTAKGENTESKRWNGLIEVINDEFPSVSIEMWNDTRITTEIQEPTSAGIHKYWFENSEMAQESFSFAFEKAENSWLSTRYVSDLNVIGEISCSLEKFVGDYDFRISTARKLSRISELCLSFDKASDNLLSVCGDKSAELVALLSETKEQLEVIAKESIKVQKWLFDESSTSPTVDERIFFINYNLLVEKIKECKLNFSYHFHISDVTKILKQLSQIDYNELLKDVRDCLSCRSLLFLGDPGTGKTHGVGAFAEKMLNGKFHLPLLIQARSIKPDQNWKDIVVQYLGLGNTWSEDELWQALTAAVNRNKFQAEYLSKDTLILPKIIIIVDGIDESSAHDKWIERIQETAAIVANYPQIRFCFTSRPAIFSHPDDYANVTRLNAGGDVPVYKLFDGYMKAYNITAKNSGWLKYALTTPLALKLFCELNRNKTVEISNSSDISMEALWRKKIEKMEDEFNSKEGLPSKNQNIFKAVVLLSELFLDNVRIDRENLIDTISKNLNLEEKITQNLIFHLELYGVLRDYCEHGTGLSPDKYYYYPGIQGYFDYVSARALLNQYAHPEKIDFNKCGSVTINTLYSLAVLSIQNYKYLLTQNSTIAKVTNNLSFKELQFVALQHTDHKTACQFKRRCLEIMGKGAKYLVSFANNLVLPLSRDVNHPLGVSLLDDFLSKFEFPAQRDIFWSIPEYLHNSSGKKWEKNESIALWDDEYTLTVDDLHNGLPTAFAWSLSNVDNSIRKYNRDKLMVWAKTSPQEYYHLFLKFSVVNDPQIKSDLFSILMCLMYDGADEPLIATVCKWIIDNILCTEMIDQNRDVSVRYYSIAILERAKMLGIISAEEAARHLPPYISDDYTIMLNKDALCGTRMEGYSAISYDLSRYVLIDHIEYGFDYSPYQKNKQFDKLIEAISLEQPDYKGISAEQFILSAAYAFILQMGWNETDFFNLEKDEDGQLKGGVDFYIRGTYHSATHGVKSSIMTVCEKYVWQARNYISGFLCDRLLFGEENTRICDYGLLDNFEIPIQGITQIDLNNIPDNQTWHIPEYAAVVLDGKNKSSKDIIDTITNAPHIDWKQWIVFENENHKYSVNAESLLALSSFSCFFGSANVETCLFISSVLLPTDEIPLFLDRMRNDKEQAAIFLNPTDWEGGINSCSYITPTEICWFPWKSRYDSYNTEKFPELTIQSAVDRCCYNFPEYGEVYYSLPSLPVRTLLGVIDSDGYMYWDRDKNIRTEYCIAGENWETQQKYLLVGKDYILDKLSKTGQSLVWIMKEMRRETGNAREKYGKFYAERSNSYIGYFEDGRFIYELLESEISSTKD